MSTSGRGHGTAQRDSYLPKLQTDIHQCQTTKDTYTLHGSIIPPLVYACPFPPPPLAEWELEVVFRVGPIQWPLSYAATLGERRMDILAVQERWPLVRGKSNTLLKGSF